MAANNNRVATEVTLDALVEKAWKAQKKKSKPAKARRAVKRTAAATRKGSFRWRYQLAPLGLILALWVIGAVVRGNPHPARVTLLLTAAAAFGWWALSRRLDRPVERRYGWVCVGFAGLWLLAAAQLGIDGRIGGVRPLTAILAGGGVLLALPWWKHYRIRATTPTFARAGLAAEWAEYVAAPNMALPGSRVVTETRIRTGITEAEVILDRGKQTITHAIAKTEAVTGALDREIGSVSIEPSRTLRAGRARVLLVDRNPLHEAVPWAGPQLFDPETGLAPIGIYVDHEPVPYRFYRPGSGPVHDLIAGATDAGKSRLLDQLLAYERHSGLMASLVIDPQMGQSLPEWVDNVGAFARGTTEGLDLLRRVESEMLARNAILADYPWTDEQGRKRRGVNHFDPAHPVIRQLGLKLWVVTIEEAHMLLAIAEAAESVKRQTAMSRKCGIKFRIATQVPLLSSLGGKMEIRDAVASGNVICLRTANGLSGQVAFNGTIPVQPHQLPREWPNGKTTSGIGYSLGASSRPAMMRSNFLEDTYQWANTGETTELNWLPVKAASAKTKVSTANPAPPASDGKVRGAVVAAMRAGHVKRGHIISASGLSIPVVRDELAAMVDEGKATKTGRDEYTLV